MSKKIKLYDATKCTGCRGCQVACKQWNDLPVEQTRNLGSYQNPQALNPNTWLYGDKFVGGTHMLYILPNNQYTMPGCRKIRWFQLHC